MFLPEAYSIVFFMRRRGERQPGFLWHTVYYSCPRQAFSATGSERHAGREVRREVVGLRGWAAKLPNPVIPQMA